MSPCPRAPVPPCPRASAPPCPRAAASLRLSASAARSLGLSVSLASPRGRDAHGAKFELLTNASQPLSLPSSRSPSMLLQSLLACCCWLCVTGCALASGALVARGLSSCLPAPVSASRLGGWSGGIQEHEEPGPREKSPAPESVGACSTVDPYSYVHACVPIWPEIKLAPHLRAIDELIRTFDHSSTRTRLITPLEGPTHLRLYE